MVVRALDGAEGHSTDARGLAGMGFAFAHEAHANSPAPVCRQEDAFAKVKDFLRRNAGLAKRALHFLSLLSERHGGGDTHHAVSVAGDDEQTARGFAVGAQILLLVFHGPVVKVRILPEDGNAQVGRVGNEREDLRAGDALNADGVVHLYRLFLQRFAGDFELNAVETSARSDKQRLQVVTAERTVGRAFGDFDHGDAFAFRIENPDAVAGGGIDVSFGIHPHAVAATLHPEHGGAERAVRLDVERTDMPALAAAVSDVDSFYEKLTARNVQVTEPRDEGWGGRFVSLQDPDGYRWFLVTWS